MPSVLPTYHARRTAFGIVLLALLASCIPTSTRTLTSTGRSYGYVFNLSMANLAFDRQPDTLNGARTYLNKMNGYATVKGQKNAKCGPITAVVLAFETTDDDKSHTLVVPVAPAGGKTHELRSLQLAMTVVAPHKPEFHTIQPREVTPDQCAPVPAGRHTKADEARNHVHDLHEDLLATRQHIPAIESARLQLELTRFFMNARIRDAAYLSMEDAKQLLAHLETSTPEEEDEVKAMSQRLEPLENELRTTLPYRF